MSKDAEQRLRALMERFIDGDERSIALVKRIEGLLIEEFSDEEIFEELIEPISLYSPAEGLPYVGEQELAELFEEALRLI